MLSNKDNRKRIPFFVINYPLVNDQLRAYRIDNKARSKNDEKEKKKESGIISGNRDNPYLSHDKSIDRISGYEYPALITRH